MGTKAAEATGERLYEDFEPYCKWLPKEGQMTLEITVKGFKKEQLKVQTDNGGWSLKIYGERLVDTSSNKWIRFHKEIRLSKVCDVNEISAEFSHGVLFIAMPKEATLGQGKLFICGLETTKGTAIKVALLVVAVVALGTYIARLVSCKYTSS